MCTYLVCDHPAAWLHPTSLHHVSRLTIWRTAVGCAVWRGSKLLVGTVACIAGPPMLLGTACCGPTKRCRVIAAEGGAASKPLLLVLPGGSECRYVHHIMDALSNCRCSVHAHGVGWCLSCELPTRMVQCTGSGEWTPLVLFASVIVLLWPTYSLQHPGSC